MFFIIGFWGSGFNRLVAANYFFFFTAFGSILFYLGIVLIYLNMGGTNISVLTYYKLSNVALERFLFFSFFLAFAIKLPMFPAHV